MRILIMADHLVGLHITRYLAKRQENVVGVLLHEKRFQNHGEDIRCAAQAFDCEVREVDCTSLHHSDTIDFIKKLNPDIILSVYWRYILKAPIIAIPAKGIINFHCSFLPFNKGKNPNVWPIIEGTPAGISLHYIDEGIDTGKIIAQKQVDVEMIDTAKTLYEKLVASFLPLFQEVWPKIKADKITSKHQPDKQGSFHLAKDFDSISEIDLDQKLTARQLINLLRAKTFDPHPGAFFWDNGRKVEIKVKLDYVE